MGVTRLVVEKGPIEAGVEFRSPPTASARHPTRTRTSTSPPSQLEYEPPPRRALRRAQRQLQHDQHQHPGQHLPEGGHRHPVGQAAGQGQHPVQDRLLQARQLRDDVRRRRRPGAAARPAAQRRRAGRPAPAARTRGDRSWLSHWSGRSTQSGDRRRARRRHRHEPALPRPARAEVRDDGGLRGPRRRVLGVTVDPQRGRRAAPRHAGGAIVPVHVRRAALPRPGGHREGGSRAVAYSTPLGAADRRWSVPRPGREPRRDSP